MTYAECRAAQPVAAQVLHARGERQGRRLDRRWGRVSPQEAAEGHSGCRGRGCRGLRVRKEMATLGHSNRSRDRCRLPSFLSANLFPHSPSLHSERLHWASVCSCYAIAWAVWLCGQNIIGKQMMLTQCSPSPCRLVSHSQYGDIPGFFPPLRFMHASNSNKFTPSTILISVGTDPKKWDPGITALLTDTWIWDPDPDPDLPKESYLSEDPELTAIQIMLPNQFLQKNTIILAKHNTEMPWDEEKLCDFERLVKIFGKKLSKRSGSPGGSGSFSGSKSMTKRSGSHHVDPKIAKRSGSRLLGVRFVLTLILISALAKSGWGCVTSPALVPILQGRDINLSSLPLSRISNSNRCRHSHRLPFRHIIPLPSCFLSRFQYFGVRFGENWVCSHGNNCEWRYF